VKFTVVKGNAHFTGVALADGTGVAPEDGTWVKFFEEKEPARLNFYPVKPFFLFLFNRGMIMTTRRI